MKKCWYYSGTIVLVFLCLLIIFYISDHKIKKDKEIFSKNKIETSTRLVKDTSLVKSADDQTTLIKKEKIANVTSDSIEEFPDVFGYGPVVNSKLNSKDPRITISLDEYPKSERDELLNKLSQQKKDGFTLVDESFMSREMKIKSLIYNIGDPSPNASFELSKLPGSLHDGYIGFVMEDAPANPPSGFKSNAIRRVFIIDQDIISLEEVSAKNGIGHFTKEFVTNYIDKYPVLASTLKNGDQQFEQVVWNTDSYRYALYIISSKSPQESRKQLLELAKDITILNK